MENASKALIMAAGILLALIILGAFLMLFSQWGDIAKTEDEQKEIQQISEFNKQYQAYERNLLRGVEIASVCNKAGDNNIKNSQKDINKEIHVYVTFISDWNGISKNKACDMTDYNFNRLKKDEKNKFDEFKRKYFKCEKLEYDSDTKKVNALYFIEIDEQKLFI